MTRASHEAVLAALLMSWLALAGTAGAGQRGEKPSRAGKAAQAGQPVPVSFENRWIEPYFTSRAAKKAAGLFRAGDFDGAAQDFGRIVARLPRHSPERNPMRFLLALSLMNQSSWQAAGGIFEDLWRSYPLLAPYHAFYAARCRLRRGDGEGALAWLARVPSDSVLAPDAAMVKVDAYVAGKRWADVDAAVDAFLARFPKGPRWSEALFQRAQAWQALGRPIDQVAAAYRRVWSEAPVDVWAQRADDRLQALAQTVPPAEATRLTGRSLEELLARGMVLFDANQNAQAEAIFTQALARSGIDQNTACRLHFHLAQSVWKQRQRPRAAPLFEQAIAACRAANQPDLVARSLYQCARCYASAGDKDKAIAYYGQIEKDFAGHRLADDARLRTAEVLSGADQEAEAEKLLANLADLYPKGDMAPEALWRLAFDAWRAHDYDRALHWLGESLQRYPHEDIWYADGRALYWKARVLEKQHQGREALDAYERTVREHPLSVYAFFALARMRRSFPTAEARLVHELRAHMGDFDRRSPWHFAKQTVFGEPGFRRAVELARMGLGSEARRELARLGLRVRPGKTQVSAGREDVFWITAILLDRGGQWHASHAIPRYTLTSYRRSYPDGGREEAEWRLSYPRAFPDMVAKDCHANRVPEALQWAIMREESAFYPRAESFANALGLTQLMLRTAQRFAKGPVTRDALLEPAKNLEVGSRFLAFLLDHYGGAVPLVISGYNAGEAGVDRWLRDRGDFELDEFIESIPYDQTRGYTKRVLSSYLTYAWLYQPHDPVPRLDFSLKRRAPRKATTNHHGGHGSRGGNNGKGRRNGQAPSPRRSHRP